MKQLIILFLLSMGIQGWTQVPLDFSWYKNLYAHADSLNKKSPIHPLDTTVYSLADSLDSLHPSIYFSECSRLMKEMKFNEAAFLFHVGTMRYRYYNSVNPEYQASGDGALLASMRAMTKESMDMYLRTSVDNYVFVIRRSCNYYNNHDYEYYARDKDSLKYDNQSKSYEKFAVDLESNKTKYSDQWKQERADFESMIKTYEEQQEK